MPTLSGSDVQVKVTTTSDNSGLTQTTGAIAGLSAEATQGAQIVQTAMLVIGAAIIGVGAFSLKSASDFQGAMTVIQTQAGASAEEVDFMSKQVLALSGSVATAPIDLAKALYWVESAGFRGAAALDILKLSAEGARVGHADLGDTTKALTSIMNSHVEGVNNATDAMGQMNAIVGQGKMTLEDLNGAIGTGILPVLNQAGISFSDFGAAIDTMTNMGVGAQEGATRLRMSIAMMASPTKAAQDQFKSIGLTQFQLADDMRNKGLGPALADLKTHMVNAGLTADQQANVITRAFGGGRQSSAITALMQNIDVISDHLNAVGKHANDFQKSWEKTQKDAGTATDNLKATVNSLAIMVGDKLLPAYTNVANYLATNLIPDLQSMWNWIDKHKTVIGIVAGIIVAVLLPALVAYEIQMVTKNIIAVAKFVVEEWKMIAAFIVKTAQIVIATAAFLIHTAVTIGATVATGAMTVATWLLDAALAVLTSPILLIILAIGALIVIGILLITHWKEVMKVAGDVWNFVVKTIQDAVAAAGKWIRDFINGVIDGINSLIKGIDSVAGKIPGIGGAIQIPLIPHLAEGTDWFQGGMALVGERGPELVNLPQGSQVIPNSKIGSVGGKPGANVTVYNYIYSQVDMEQTIRGLGRKLNR
jgi:TP901 family phage tail tape measure protein